LIGIVEVGLVVNKVLKVEPKKRFQMRSMTSFEGIDLAGQKRKKKTVQVASDHQSHTSTEQLNRTP
jgi:hypothetical protein